MDVVACSNFSGQELSFIDNDRFAHLTARGLFIYDTMKGPRDITWRHEQGFLSFTVDLESGTLVYAGQMLIDQLELHKMSESNQSSFLQNPSRAAIIDMSLSRGGSLLYGLSGMTDHKIIVWNVEKSSKVLISQKLDVICKKVIVNPVDTNMACVYGSDGLRFTVLNDVFGHITLKVNSVQSVKPNGKLGFEAGPDVFDSEISFALWLPNNRLLASSVTGDIYAIKIESAEALYLGKFVDPVVKGPKQEVNIVPLCATLTINNIIIGTNEGFLYWFPLNNLLQESPGNVEGTFFKCPVQALKVVSPVCNITLDPTRSLVVFGTIDGRVFKVVADVESTEEKGDQEREEAVQETIKKNEYRVVQSESIGNETNGGISMCSKFASIGVRKITSKARANLTFLCLGSHNGLVKLWRHSASSADAALGGGGGIRRSTPRVTKEIFGLKLKSSSKSNNELAVCALEVVRVKTHCMLLFIGCDSGLMEVWKIEAIENEDEDFRDVGQESDVKLIEDDEGSCVVRIDAQFQIRSKVFNSSITAFAAMYTNGTDSEARVLTYSSDCSKVYVFNAVTDGEINLGPVFSVIDLFNCRPTCLTVSEDLALIFASDCSMIRYPQDSNSSLIDKEVVFQSCGVIQLMEISCIAQIAVVVNMQGLAWYLQLDGPKPSSRASFSGSKLLEHPDSVSALAFSPAGDVFVTGCIDGYITIWKIDIETLDVLQANQVALHSDAVLSLTISPNSTSLFSSALDGTCFVLAFGKMTSKLVAKQSMKIEGVNMRSSDKTSFTVSAANDTDLILNDQMDLERKKELKAMHKFKCMGVSAAVQEIQHRLSVLIKQNEERSDLEQLNREEFVVDVDKKTALEKKHSEDAKILSEKYFRRLRWLELLSARLKNISWDLAVEASVLLKPFVGLVEIDAMEMEGVSSFPINKTAAEEQVAVQKAMQLRAFEIRAMKRSGEGGNLKHLKGSPFFRCAWALSTKGCSPEVSWIVNEGFSWPLLNNFDDQLIQSNVPSTATNSALNGKAQEPESLNTGLDEDEDASVLSNEGYYEVDEKELLNLIYPPEAVRSVVQKRNQIIFLKEVVKRIKLRFNKLFRQLQKDKEEAMQFISSRNERISTILEELHQTEKVWMPTLTNQERKGSAITVGQDEMIARPYESEEARLQRMREAEERALRQQSDENQLIKERALVDMMHGTLEVKRDVFAEALLLQRPPWMDTLTPAEMSDVQLKEYEAYQNKLRELQEEQAHYRKTLEQEMKKLKQEIAESSKSFNEKLELLGRLKVLAYKEVLAQEIYIIRISCSMVKSEHLRSVCKSNENKLQEARRLRSDTKTRNEKLNKSLEELKARISAVLEEEKAMDKAFRRDLQNLCNNTFDQDSLKVFTTLYRKRLYPRGGLLSSLDNYGDQSEMDVSASASNRMRRSVKDASNSRRGQNRSQSRRAADLNGTKNVAKNRLKSSRNVSSSAMVGGKDSAAAAMGPMQQAAQALLNTEPDNSSSIKEKDPYNDAILAKAKAKKVLEAQIPLLNPLSMELDCPEGFVVDQFSWSKLQELRNARIEKEIEGKLLSIEQTEVKTKLSVMEQEEVVVSNNLSEIRLRRDNALEQLQNTETNLDIIISLLQGQDEMDRDAVATDYVNALIFPVDVIAKYNGRIKELGSEKISILSKTKVFRRKINLISWEAKHQALQARHFEAYYTDLQLFRVTRDLQKVILEGESANNQKDRVEKASARKEFLGKDYQMKMGQEMRNLIVLRRSLQEKEQESRHLETVIAQLNAEVQQSESIKYSKIQASGGEGQANAAATQKMKKVIRRKKLVDVARVQAEEIEILRQELDRMRQRTFPSFVKATKKRLMNAPY